MENKCVICGEKATHSEPGGVGPLCEDCYQHMDLGIVALAVYGKFRGYTEITNEHGTFNKSNWHTHPTVIERREAVGWTRRVHVDNCGQTCCWHAPDGMRREYIPLDGLLPGDKIPHTPPLGFVPFTDKEWIEAGKWLDANTLAGTELKYAHISKQQYRHIASGSVMFRSPCDLQCEITPAAIEDNEIFFVTTRQRLTWTRPAPDEKPPSMDKYMSQDVHPAISDERLPESGFSMLRRREIKPHTYSARFEFPNGDVVEIPEPGDGWEEVRHCECDKWQHEHVVTTGTLNGDGKVPSIWINGSPQIPLDIAHIEGQVILYEYENRMNYEKARCLSWTKWRKLPEPPTPTPERYESEFPLLKGDCPDCKKPLKECECDGR